VPRSERFTSAASRRMSVKAVRISAPNDQVNCLGVEAGARVPAMTHGEAAGPSRDRLPKKKSKELVLAAIENAANVSSLRVEQFLRAARRRNPDSSDAELLKTLERSYTALVATTGFAAGGTAALPAVNLPGSLVATIADAGAFTSASAIYVLAVANVYGLDVEDVERRRALLLTVLAGPEGPAFVEKLAGRTGPYWGRRITSWLPISHIRRINRVLGPNVVTKYGTKQGAIVLGKVIPFGIGAVIGAGGNAAMARLVIRATRSAFGPPSGPNSESTDPTGGG
jgi:hypothetical protein